MLRIIDLKCHHQNDENQEENDLFCIGEYISLELFYFVSLTGSWSLIPEDEKTNELLLFFYSIPVSSAISVSLPWVSFKRRERPDRLTAEQQGSASVPFNLCAKFSLCCVLVTYSVTVWQATCKLICFCKQ